MNKYSIILFFFLVNNSDVIAQLRLPAIISDNMVLQAEIKNPIWGWASPGQEITVNIQDKTASTIADTNGYWRVEIEKLSPNRDPLVMTIHADRVNTIKNILVGEVWLCSGQSNMLWPLEKTRNAQSVLKNANHTEIRLFKISPDGSDTLKNKINAKWVVCSSEEAGRFSAVGYFFGKELHERLNKPVGLIQAAYGGSDIIAWMPKSIFEKNSYAQKTLEYFRSDAYMSRIENMRKRYAINLIDGILRQHGPGNLYNAMIHPIAPYGIKGVIWYQGEENVKSPESYDCYFKSLINSWRDIWSQGDFPFYFVQLPNFGERETFSEESNWAQLREKQFNSLAVLNTGMAVTIDLGSSDDIHPKEKSGVGHRLCLQACAKTYGMPLQCESPVPEVIRKKGGNIYISFKYIYNGISSINDSIRGFTMVTKDKKFVNVNAKIINDQIVLSSKSVKHPLYIYYAWANNPYCDIYNSENLPFAPFRLAINGYDK